MPAWHVWYCRSISRWTPDLRHGEGEYPDRDSAAAEARRRNDEIAEARHQRHLEVGRKAAATRAARKAAQND